MKKIKYTLIILGALFTIAVFSPKNAYSQYTPSAGYVYNSTRISDSAALRRRAAASAAGYKKYYSKAKRKTVKRKVAKRRSIRRRY